MIEKRESVLATIKRKSLHIKKQSSKQWAQILATLAANLGFFSSGLHFGWSSPSVPILTAPNATIPLTEDELSWIITIQPIGDIIGAAFFSYLCNVIGRKNTILLTTIPHIISWLCIAFATNAEMLILGRFISGLSEGSVYVCIPIYLGEILEPKVRGRWGASATIICLSGIAIINIIGTLFTIKETALIALTIPIITIFVFMVMPESPYYSLIKNQKQRAEKDLRFLRQTHDVSSELESINYSLELQMKNPTTFKELFTDASNRRALLTMAVIRVIQQCCGTSVISYFLIPIFNMSGTNFSVLAASSCFAISQISSSLLCSALVDRFGRKPLMIISLIGASASFTTLGVFFYFKNELNYDVSSVGLLPVMSVLSFVIFLNIGYGTIPTLLLSEFFPANVKAKSLCLMQMLLASMFFASSKIFLFLMNNFGVYVPFLFFASSAFIGIFFTIFFVPETKGKTLQEIQNWFHSR